MSILTPPLSKVAATIAFESYESMLTQLIEAFVPRDIIETPATSALGLARVLILPDQNSYILRTTFSLKRITESYSPSKDGARILSMGIYSSLTCLCLRSP
jgi:hypothetical protein